MINKPQKTTSPAAKKNLGQNFLHDKNIIHKIISAINPKQTDCLLEIGPGLGALTIPLLESGSAVSAVEIDKDMITYLAPTQARFPEFQLYHQDALKFNIAEWLEKTGSSHVRIIGNLPYNISTPLFFHFLKYPHLIQDMHFMVQKEVADRIAAHENNKQYGRLTVMIQAVCRAEKLFTVPRGAFTPAPNVESAIIRLTPYTAENSPYPIFDNKWLHKVVLQLFSQRRKTLHNLLKPLAQGQAWTPQEFFNHHPEFSSLVRPENLSVTQIIYLSNRLREPHLWLPM